MACRYVRPFGSLLLLAASSIFAVPLVAQSSHPWTVAEIFGRDRVSTGEPPQGISWSPDGKRATWIDEDGNLMQIQPPETQPQKLLPAQKITALLNATISEKDRDHRDRYDEPDYIWSPDSQHLLFDTDGQLWLYDLKNTTGVQIGNTSMQSGDDPKFSPSGQYISYVRDHNLWAQRIDGSTPPIPLTTTRDETLLNGGIDWVYLEELNVRSNYFWSPDSKQVAYLQMNESSVPVYPLVDFNLVHATVDPQRYPQPGDPNPAVRVGVVGINGGTTRWLRIPLDAGNDYIPRFGWLNPHVVWVETLSRSQQHSTLWFADVHSGEIRQVFTESDAKYLNTTYDVTFVGDHQFLILSWRDGHTHIYRYTFDPANPFGAEAKLANQLESGDYEVQTIKAVDPQSQTVWYLAFDAATGQQQVWAVQLDGSNRRPITRSPGVHDPDFAPQSGAFIDTYSARLTPPTVASCSGTGVCEPFWSSKPLEGHRLIAPQTLELTAADKTTPLYGTLLLPPGKSAPHSVPLIVNPYGGPDVGTATDSWDGPGFFFDQFLAEHGFAVLHVDNRGMGGRGRDFEQACYHSFGPPQFADQMASVDQVLRQYPELDPHRLGWWGWSWGGSFTLFALSHSESFLAGVSVAPVTDWRDYDSIYTERYMGLPSEDANNYHEDSDVTSAANLHGHLLLMHGTGDDNVHIEGDMQYIEQLIKAHIPYDYNVFPRKTHSISGPDDHVVLFTKIVDHFDRYVMHSESDDKPDRRR
ncbi:MAG: alpha/beta fold hydrolase [Acidobacteriaceae bacterium]